MPETSEHNISLDQEEIKREFLRSRILVILFSVLLIVAFLNYQLMERDLINYYG